jgi:hypothetical protein
VKHDLNDFKVFHKILDCLVLREHCLAKHDLTVVKHTNQAQSIEHTYNSCLTRAKRSKPSKTAAGGLKPHSKPITYIAYITLFILWFS